MEQAGILSELHMDASADVREAAVSAFAHVRQAAESHSRTSGLAALLAEGPATKLARTASDSSLLPASGQRWRVDATSGKATLRPKINETVKKCGFRRPRYQAIVQSEMK